MRELSINEMSIVSGGEDEERILEEVVVTAPRPRKNAEITNGGGGGFGAAAFFTSIDAANIPLGIGDIDLSTLEQQLEEFNQAAEEASALEMMPVHYVEGDEQHNCFNEEDLADALTLGAITAGGLALIPGFGVVAGISSIILSLGAVAAEESLDFAVNCESPPLAA